MLIREQQKDIIFGLATFIERKFDLADWTKLGYEYHIDDLINEHPRLLRSLQWRDPDYFGNIISVFEDVASRSFLTLVEITQHVDLELWLKLNRHDLYERVYGEYHTRPKNLIEEASLDTETYDLSKQISRISASVDTDPELAVGQTKEMLETVLKTILSGTETNLDKMEIPELLKKVTAQLELFPPYVAHASIGETAIKRTLGSLSQIVISIAELRNKFGTGHGKLKNSSGLDGHHARLVVNAGITLVTFLSELHQLQKD